MIELSIVERNWTRTVESAIWEQSLPLGVGVGVGVPLMLCQSKKGGRRGKPDFLF